MKLEKQTIFDWVRDTLSGREGCILTTSEIRELVVRHHGANPSSVIPSDYCYNRTNAGIPFKRHLFIRINANEYQFVGEGHNYTGWVYHRPTGTSSDSIAGEWKNGKPVFYAEARAEEDTTAMTFEAWEPSEEEPTCGDPHVKDMSRSQLEYLYAEYMGLLKKEVDVFGCKPTEVRHLIGRVGEFRCALITNGRLAREVNQHGFDVVSEEGRRISVKTTAQAKGFVSINKSTCHRAEDLMVLRYINEVLEVVYYGPMEAATASSRLYDGRYELELSKATAL